MAKSLTFLLRFETEAQKKKLMKIAKQSSRSLNSEILNIINMKILSGKSNWAVGIDYFATQNGGKVSSAKVIKKNVDTGK